MASAEQKAALNALSAPSGASIIADATHMLIAYPLLMFGLIGALGGIMGYLLLIEQGKLDALTWAQSMCVMNRRIILGAGIGIVVYVGWADQSQARGLWLLATGIIATSPIDMIRKVIELAQQMLTRKAGS